MAAKNPVNVTSANFPSSVSASQLTQETPVLTLEVNEEPVRQVRLDALVALKIIKHCREALPALVTGQLLGMDVHDQLEITNCFAFPSRDALDEGGDHDGPDYQIEMMRCLRLVNIDHSTAGWYQSAYFSSYINQSTVDTQFTYQEAIEKSVLIVYDTVRSDQGYLSLKALRLSPQFMQSYRERRLTLDSLIQYGLTSETIFEEVPIVLHNIHLVDALMFELEEAHVVGSDYHVFETSELPYLERITSLMIDNVDALTAEQGKFQQFYRNAMKLQQQQLGYLHRRQQENAQRVAQGLAPLDDEDLSLNPLFKSFQEPNRLDFLLLSSQLHQYTDQAYTHADQIYRKFQLASHLK